MPDKTFSASLDWDTPWVSGLSLNGRVIYTSGSYLTSANNPCRNSPTGPASTSARVMQRRSTDGPSRSAPTSKTFSTRNCWLTTGTFVTVGSPRTYILSAAFDLLTGNGRIVPPTRILPMLPSVWRSPGRCGSGDLRVTVLAMTKRFIALIALLCRATPAQAHQIWIEQADGQNAVVRFGEFGENLREASPGLLDKFVKPTGTLVSGQGRTEVRRHQDGRWLHAALHRPPPGDGIVAEDASYPLYTWKQQDKDTTNWYYPAARFITGFAAQQPKLVLDLVPTGEDGQFKLFFKDQPKAKTKVTLVTQSGWSKEAHTDEQGLVKFDMPWKGTYVAEVSFNDRTAGERAGANGAEKYDGVSYATTVTYREGQRHRADPRRPAGHANRQMTLARHRVRSTGPLISRIVAALFGGYALAALGSVAVLALPMSKPQAVLTGMLASFAHLRRRGDLGVRGAQRAEGLGGAADRGRAAAARGMVRLLTRAGA